MKKIKLEDAIVLWTANHEPWTTPGNWAPAGSITVLDNKKDDLNAWTRYPSSFGACNGDYVEGDDDYRLQQLADLIEQLRTDDGMNINHVVEAFSSIEQIERIVDFKPRLRR